MYGYLHFQCTTVLACTSQAQTVLTATGGLLLNRHQLLSLGILKVSRKTSDDDETYVNFYSEFCVPRSRCHKIRGGLNTRLTKKNIMATTRNRIAASDAIRSFEPNRVQLPWVFRDAFIVQHGSFMQTALYDKTRRRHV